MNKTVRKLLLVQVCELWRFADTLFFFLYIFKIKYKRFEPATFSQQSPLLSPSGCSSSPLMIPFYL